MARWVLVSLLVEQCRQPLVWDFFLECWRCLVCGLTYFPPYKKRSTEEEWIYG